MIISFTVSTDCSLVLIGELGFDERITHFGQRHFIFVVEREGDGGTASEVDIEELAAAFIYGHHADSDERP